MITLSELWPEFKDSKQYREEFVAQQAKQAIPFQISGLLKQFKLTQTELASRAGVTQGVVSRAADPTYGNLTINTLVRIAAGFDVAFVPLFVPFSEIPKWFARIYEEPFTVPSFEEEAAIREEQERDQVQLAAALGAIDQAAGIASNLLADITLAASAITRANVKADLSSSTMLAAFVKGFADAMATWQLKATDQPDNALRYGVIDTLLTTSPSQDSAISVDYQIKAQLGASLGPKVNMPDQATAKSQSMAA